MITPKSRLSDSMDTRFREYDGGLCVWSGLMRSEQLPTEASPYLDTGLRRYDGFA